MIIRTRKERSAAIEAGRRLGEILQAVAMKVAPGVSTDALDRLAEELIRQGGDEPSFLGYTPEGAPRPYPASLCVSINDEVVHGIPNEHPRILREGDIVSLDLGLTHEGIVMDSAITVAVGKVDDASRALMAATERALSAGIAAAKAGNHVGDISHAIEESYRDTGFSIVKVLGGHGVGGAVHEEPWIANVGRAGEGPELVEGQILALEPIATLGKGAVSIAPDGYTYRTKDGSRAAHFEHTILIEETGPRILTRRPNEK